MRLNPLHPSDNPMDEILFCFGGGDDGGGGGSGGGSAGDFDDSYNTSMGYDAGFDDGDTGDTGGSSDASGDPSEESTVDFSGGPGFDDGDTGDTGDSGAVAGSFGGGDTGAGAAGPALIDSYLDGPMLADISTPMTGGAFVDPTTGYGIMSDIPGGGMQSALDASTQFSGAATAGPGAASSGSDQDSLLGQIGPDGEKFDYSTDDIFGDLTPGQLAVQEYVSGLKAGTPAADIVSQARASAVTPTRAEVQGTPVGIETIRGPMDTKQSTQQERAAAAALAAGSLTPADIANRVAGGSGFSTRPSGRPNEGILSIDGREYTFDGSLPGDQRTYSPLAAAGVTAARDVRPGATMSPEARAVVEESNRMGSLIDQARQNAANIGATISGIRAGIEDEPIGGAIDVQSVIDQAKANTQQSISSGAPTPSTVESAAAMEDVGAITGGTQPSPDFDAGDVGDFYDFLAPEVQKKADEEAKAIREAVEQGKTLPGEVNIFEPGSIVKDVMRNFTQRDEEFARQANLPGARLQTNAQGQITGVYNPQENSVYTPDSVGFFDFEGQEAAAGDLYAMQREQQQREQESQGGGDQTTMPAEVAPVAPKTCPDGYTYDEASDSCVYQGRAIVRRAQYQPAAQPRYAYTGLPTLAPVSLRPSFQASGNYGPLFNFR